MTMAQADACHLGGWNDTEIERFTRRVLVFTRRGTRPPQADNIAERLVLRDRQADRRSVCLECEHYQPGRCHNHVRAGLSVPRIGTDIATQLQHCGGFLPWD